jgi:hypothetical protein
MVFVQTAVVWHHHPTTFTSYLRRKIKFAFWRVPAIKNTPGKIAKDSHHPQLMKAQLLFAPALLSALLGDLLSLGPIHPLSLVIVALFVTSTLPFALRAFRKDPMVGILAPVMLAGRSCAQLIGVIGGTIYISHRFSRRISQSATARR